MACLFVFDIIITQFESPYVLSEELDKVIVEVTLDNKVINITSSQINVKEFQQGSSTEFIQTPEKLQESLEKCGMDVTVKLSNSIIGMGHMSFPKPIVENITGDMTELLHLDSCLLGRQTLVVGKVEFLCRLVLKSIQQM